MAAGKLARPASVTEGGGTARSASASAGSNATALPEADKAIIDRVEELSNKKGWSMSQVATAWSNRRIASPIIGFSSIRRIDEALEVKGKELNEDEEKYLEEPYKPKNIVGHS